MSKHALLKERKPQQEGLWVGKACETLDVAGTIMATAGLGHAAICTAAARISLKTLSWLGLI